MPSLEIYRLQREEDYLVIGNKMANLLEQEKLNALLWSYFI